jgi:hypothetical protein
MVYIHNMKNRKNMPETVETITETLQASVAKITYEKEDGEVVSRRMTLKPDMLLPVKGTNATASLEVVRAIDLDKNGWRSVRVANIKTVEIIE